jgi:hypothetical protein
VNSNGSIFRGSVSNPTDLQAIIKNIDEFSGAIEVGMSMSTSYGELAFNYLEDLRWTCSHILNERLAAKGLIFYDADLSSADTSLLNLPVVQPLLAVARATAAHWIP